MRLITRADLDGLVSAVFITLMEEIEEILFAEPNPIQTGAVEVKHGDVIANLPYHPNCSLWFDHHVSNRVETPFRGHHRLAPSAARVIYEYYHDRRLIRYESLLIETDRIDSADLRREETTNPEGYLLLAMTIDGKYGQDRPYWIKLIELLKECTLDEILREAEVSKRCEAFRQAQKIFERTLRKHTRREGAIIISDFRGLGEPPMGNRFLVYNLFPDALISLKLADDPHCEEFTAISLGKNIFDKSSPISVGPLLAAYGGGGHTEVGSCRVPKADADKVVNEILSVLRTAHPAHDS
jgi:hypothetical protein